MADNNEYEWATSKHRRDALQEAECKGKVPTAAEAATDRGKLAQRLVWQRERTEWELDVCRRFYADAESKRDRWGRRSKSAREMAHWQPLISALEHDCEGLEAQARAHGFEALCWRGEEDCG